MMDQQKKRERELFIHETVELMIDQGVSITRMQVQICRDIGYNTFMSAYGPIPIIVNPLLPPNAFVVGTKD